MATTKRTADENNFDALDRTARGITPRKLHPLTREQQTLLKAAKCGRPKKLPGGNPAK
jgi:hypothetical protein